MAEQEQNTTDTAAPTTGPILEWTVHPVLRQPWVSVAVSAFVIVVVILVHSWMQSHVFTLLAMLIMLGSLAKFYFPTRYKMDGKGVTVKTTTQTLVKEWKLYRSCYPDKKGILLSPFATPTRLENFRGLYIMFERNNDEVTAFVRERVARAQQSDAPAVESEKT
jgi:hypothetical protein